MPEPSASEVNQLLLAWSAGEQSALEKLAPLGRQELRRLAKAYMRRERPGHTQQTTALVNEAYLRLVNVNAVLRRAERGRERRSAPNPPPHGRTRVELGQGVALSRTQWRTQK
jgi:ECF sigma factor